MSAEAIEFWSGLKGSQGDVVFSRLSNSIYDFLRNTSELRPPQTQARDAKNYVLPEMFRILDMLLETGFGKTAYACEHTDIATLDKLLYAYYKAHSYRVWTATREGGEEGKMPLITRGTLSSWLALQVCGEKSVRAALSAFMSDEEYYLVDQETDEPWRHALPEECLPSLDDDDDNAALRDQYARGQELIRAKWDAAREDIFHARRAEVEAEHEAERISAQEAQMRTMHQAGSNSVNMSNRTANIVGNMGLANAAQYQAG